MGSSQLKKTIFQVAYGAWLSAPYSLFIKKTRTAIRYDKLIKLCRSPIRLRQFFLPFSLVQKHECRNKSYILSLPKQKAKGSGLMQNNTLMLWKDDFKSDRDWQAVCRALGLSENTVEVEPRCNVRVAKSNYTHTKLHKPEPFSFASPSN